MRRRPPRSTRTDTLFPYTTLFRSEFSAKYSDNPGGDFAINPYAKLFWAVESKSSTVVLGKAGGTFELELGAVPKVTAGAIKLSAPTWISSEERRVGDGFVMTGRARWSQYH